MANRWIAGLVGGVVASIVAFLVAGALFLGVGGPILFNPDLQSAKLIAVWQEIEPLPVMSTNMPVFMVGVALLGLLQGGVFAWIIKGLPEPTLKRGSGFGLVLFLLIATYFEFFTPYNLFGEPLPLIALELFFWFIVTQVQGIVLSFVYKALAR